VHHFDQRLARAQAGEHVLAARARADTVDKRLHHRQRDVGLEQCQAHFAQRLAHVVVGEPPFAAQPLDRLLQSLA